MFFVKSHGLGNDYLVLAEGPVPSPAQVRLLCDRNRGFGSDGILVPVSSERAPFGLRIFNPDGSEAEKSGNGLRIFARFLRDHRGAPAAFDIEVGGGVVSCRTFARDVEVEMGRATFDPRQIPMVGDSEAVDLPLPAEVAEHRFTAVGMGNPHCVIFVERELDSLPWRDWGRQLEVHPLFPRRTNVQVARIVDAERIEARIWERGAGETLASGSSACAVACAAVRTGRAEPGLILVRMPGGDLEVTVRSDWSVLLRGPVEEVGSCRPSADLLAMHRGL